MILYLPVDAGPYTLVAADALVLKVREGGRVVNVHALVGTGVNGDAHREFLGLRVSSAEDGAGWLAFFRDLTARGLTGVALVTPMHTAGWRRGSARPCPGPPGSGHLLTSAFDGDVSVGHLRRREKSPGPAAASTASASATPPTVGCEKPSCGGPGSRS